MDDISSHREDRELNPMYVTKICNDQHYHDYNKCVDICFS